jgi:Ni2+-binding GTPase involved in maturation of urease and hydrogenase
MSCTAAPIAAFEHYLLWTSRDLCTLLQVGLAGPSGSGKTAFSEKVRSFIPGCTVLSMDNYNDASRLIDGNFDGEPIGWSLHLLL